MTEEGIAVAVFQMEKNLNQRIIRNSPIITTKEEMLVNNSCKRDKLDLMRTKILSSRLLFMIMAQLLPTRMTDTMTIMMMKTIIVKNTPIDITDMKREI